MSEIILKIAETSQQYIGRSRGVVDPKIIEDQKQGTCQIIELTRDKKHRQNYGRICLKSTGQGSRNW